LRPNQNPPPNRLTLPRAQSQRPPGPPVRNLLKPLPAAVAHRRQPPRQIRRPRGQLKHPIRLRLILIHLRQPQGILPSPVQHVLASSRPPSCWLRLVLWLCCVQDVITNCERTTK